MEATMLVLSRKVDEAILAGPLTIRVLEVRGNTVRLGLEAPRDFEILREELLGRPGVRSQIPNPQSLFSPEAVA
jgi:carbon storage regulator CsrA